MADIMLDRALNCGNSPSLKAATPHIARVFPFHAPPRLIPAFSDASTVCGLELTTVTVDIYADRFNLAHRCVAEYVDNNAVLGAGARGQTRGSIAHNMISALWMTVAIFDISLWLGRLHPPLTLPITQRGAILPLPDTGIFYVPNDRRLAWIPR